MFFFFEKTVLYYVGKKEVHTNVVICQNNLI